jgi:methanogenic corrinoid protein MtbC1
MTDVGNLAEALARCEEQRVMTLLKEKLNAGTPAAEILGECNRGMALLGDRFASGDCYLPELMFGGMIMKSVSTELAPLLEQSGPVEAVGKAVVGTVLHDVHDIGKDILVMMLRGNGFDVIDLGVDVPPEKFVEAVAGHKPQVAGFSVLLTTCYKSVGDTVEAIRAAGLREGLSLMVGGAAASQLLAESAGCDFYGKTAVDGVNFARQLVGA